MTLAPSATVLVGDDSGKRDVQETRLAFVRASMPATDARRRTRRRHLCCVQKPGSSRNRRGLLSDCMNERMLWLRKLRDEETESWERPKTGRYISSK